MTITTKTYPFSKFRYFKTSVSLFFRKHWKLFLGFLVLSIFALVFGDIGLATNVITISFLFAVVVVLLNWIKTNSRRNFKFYQSRYLKIDNKSIRVYIKKRLATEYLLDDLEEQLEEKNAIIFNFGKKGFIYLPKTAIEKTALEQIKQLMPPKRH